MVSGVSGILLPVSATRPIGNNQFGMHEAHVDPESAVAKSVLHPDCGLDLCLRC